jgi:hypothetical protein
MNDNIAVVAITTFGSPGFWATIDDCVELIMDIVTLVWYPLGGSYRGGNILLCRYEQNSMPKGMEQAGQLLFPGARPALLTTHENHGIRFENVEHAWFQVPTEAYPNHDLQVLAIHPHEGLEALFRESFGNWRSCYRKLARHDLRGPKHNPRIQAASPLACRA